MLASLRKFHPLTVHSSYDSYPKNVRVVRVTQVTANLDGKPARLRNLNTDRTTQDPRPRIRPRGIPQALEAHRVYSSLDPGKASQLGSDLLGDHHITPGDAGDFHALYHAVLMRDVTLGYLDFGTSFSIEINQLTPDQLIMVPTVGTCLVENQESQVAASPVHAIVPVPDSPMTLQGENQTALVILRIHSRALQVHLSKLLSRGLHQPLTFDLGFDLTPPSASRWNLAVQMLHSELHENHSLLHRGIGIGSLEEFVMSALLYSHRSSFSDQLTEPARHQRGSVRRAQEYIQQNLQRQLSIEDIAESADIGVRSLQNFFREDLKQTPTAYIRDLRLEGARADLADTTRGTTVSVTDVATKWGFSHHGRFAKRYRDRFGETPSQTLKS